MIIKRYDPALTHIHPIYRRNSNSKTPLRLQTKVYYVPSIWNQPSLNTSKSKYQQNLHTDIAPYTVEYVDMGFHIFALPLPATTSDKSLQPTVWENFLHLWHCLSHKLFCLYPKFSPIAEYNGLFLSKICPGHSKEKIPGEKKEPGSDRNTDQNFTQKWFYLIKSRNIFIFHKLFVCIREWKECHHLHQCSHNMYMWSTLYARSSYLTIEPLITMIFFIDVFEPSHPLIPTGLS